MHILMLSDNETRGGAAVGASNLAIGLTQIGVKVTRLVNRADGKNHAWQTVPLKLSHQHRFMLRVMEKFSPKIATIFDTYLTKKRLNKLLVELKPDIINVHNLHGANWSPALIETCLNYAPTVWTLHDMWSFTGRCAYSYDCQKFISGCDDTCPTWHERPALHPKRINAAWQLRQKIFAKYPDLVAACPSRWLAKTAKQGMWHRHRVEVISHNLPLDVYIPLERDLARHALGIETSMPVGLVVAHDLMERRKGINYLIEALSKINQPMTVVTLGQGKLLIENKNIHLHALGYIDHERSKVLAYNSADFLIHAAPVDNLPSVVLESIVCGTPVVGFPIGGMIDMVRPNQTGWLADKVDGQSLAMTIERAITDVRQNRILRQSCRAIAESEYALTMQAKQYYDLFQDLA